MNGFRSICRRFGDFGRDKAVIGFRRRRPWTSAALAFLTLLLGCASSRSGETIVLFVGTSGDYAPFSTWEPGEPGAPPAYGGFGPAVARAYAADRGFEVRFVQFAWPDLIAELEAGRFEVAMSGVTVRPERSIAGRFSLPVARSGAVVLTRLRPGARPPRSLAAVDVPGGRIAVNAGGHLERVARASLTRATIVPIDNNAGVREALASGDFDTVVTDTQEAPHWKRAVRDVAQIGPFTQDRKAFLVGAHLPELSRDLDAWLMANEANGRMEALRDEHLQSEESAPEIGFAMTALLASIDERLALMPAVAEAKRRSGAAIEAPEREQRVLDAAVEAALKAADDADLTPPSSGMLRALFRAQIEAAKQIQRDTLAKPADPSVPVADLSEELRPALIRIGERIAALAVQKPKRTRQKAIVAATRTALSARGLDAKHIAAIASALIRLDKESRED